MDLATFSDCSTQVLEPDSISYGRGQRSVGTQTLFARPIDDSLTLRFPVHLTLCRSVGRSMAQQSEKKSGEKFGLPFSKTLAKSIVREQGEQQSETEDAALEPGAIVGVIGLLIFCLPRPLSSPQSTFKIR
ncbi:hypothetical protein VTO58DRAFT_107218 [Aureobasidium pullulans]